MERDPYALGNLLPTGTVLLELSSEGDLPVHSGDRWSTLNTILCAHDLRLASASQNIQRDLDFLVEHDFVRATWKCVASQFHVRVYLVPFDLPGVHGCLRHRNEFEVVIPARGRLFSVLSVTDRCAKAWANHTANSSIAEPFIRPPYDGRSLSEIFGDIPSPQVDSTTFLSGASPETKAAFQQALRWEAPPRMRPLYPYQKRTVARMLRQELDPGLAIDPLYLAIDSIADSKRFYLQPSTMELLHDPPMRAQARGGILCEEMGTGKTCMVLALIMATKSQLSAPEEPPWNAPARPVLTPIALRQFRSSTFREAQSAAGMKISQIAGFPTLLQLLTHFVRTNPERLEPPELVPVLEGEDHLWTPIMRNVPFYHVYEPVPETSYQFRRGEQRGPRKMYLTTATLVIVPGAIVAQWNAEINKHCDGGSLRVLTLGDGERAAAIPPAEELASGYDMVLMTHERFSAERKRCDPKMLYTWRLCSCDHEDKYHDPCSTCLVCRAVSPLVQIRWKRLVLDEGHVSATTSQLAVLAQEVSVERRWIVSGTPTRNLMGVSLGLSHKPFQTGDDGDDGEGVDKDDLGLGELSYPDDAENTEEYSSDSNQVESHEAPHTRPWSNMDRFDLNRLGDMITKFIGVPQFAYENTFRKYVVAPLMNRNGPTFGAIKVLSQVMEQVMFRHQIHIVELELPDKLPLLKEKTVVLGFQPLAAKTYNVLQSIIAINAVDSERTGQDYLFHPTNRGRLAETLQNLTQTMFWRTDERLFDIDDAIDRSKVALEVAIERGRPEHDIRLVREAIRVQIDAAGDHIWREVMVYDGNPFVIRGLSPGLQNAWLRMKTSPRTNGVSLLDSDRIIRLRNILINTPFIAESRLIKFGVEFAEEEEENARKYEEYLRNSKYRNKRKFDEDAPKSPKTSILTKEISNAGSKEKLREINMELSAAIDRKERGISEETLSSPRHPPAHAELAARSQFSSLTIGNSLSSKVDYILRKILKHAAKEKYLIFSAFPLSLAYVAEALEVVQVPYLLYTSTVKAEVRRQTVVTFETSDKYRVLLMELKLGARGLNLVTASRIIFCEPVWHGDVESQAIKRAHRIGQKSRQIKVSTVVMRGTSEEAMVTRRHSLKQKSSRWEEDAGMRRFVENPTFIGEEDIDPDAFDVEGLNIPLVPRSADPAPEVVHAMARSDEDVSTNPRIRVTPLPSSTPDEQSPAKKIKIVHFA